MHFSIGCALSFMCVNMLLFLPVQGHLEQTIQELPIGPPVALNCCMKVSKAPIKDTVIRCYEQKENTTRNCKVHAYIFVTASGQYCVDPNAKWLPRRLRILEAQGIICQVQRRASNHPADRDTLII